VEGPFKPVIYLVTDAPVLYSSEFEIMNYRFSGLIAFRKMNDGEIRSVFLSETGLRIMEFGFKNGEIQNTYCVSFLNKKRIIKFVQKFIILLLEKPECEKFCIEDAGNKSISFCKHMKKRIYVEELKHKRINACFSRGNSKACGTYADSAELPDKIRIRMGYRTRISLKKVTNAFK
jgi:hypothetical protein